jgi:CNT family concentrative nucleoside transporter
MIAKLGLKALLAGSLSNLMSAALAGLMLGVAPPAGDPRASERLPTQRRCRTPRKHRSPMLQAPGDGARQGALT